MMDRLDEERKNGRERKAKISCCILHLHPLCNAGIQVQLILYSGNKAATQKDDIMLIASHQHEAVELDKLSVRETVSVLVRIVDVECRDLYEGESDPRLSWSLLLQISQDDVSRMELD